MKLEGMHEKESYWNILNINFIYKIDNKVDVDMPVNAKCIYFSTIEIEFSL